MDVVGGRVGADGGDGEKRCTAAVEVAARVLRHLVLVGAAGGHRDTAAAGARLVVDGQRRAARVVEEDVGRVAVGGGADGRVVAGGPIGGRVQVVPTRFVVGADVARQHVGLHRLGGGDGGAGHDAAVDVHALAEVDRLRLVDAAVAVLVDVDDGAVLAGHDGERDVLEHGGGGDVLADRHFEGGAVIARRGDAGGVGKHRAGGRGPGGTRHGEGPRGAEPVAAIVQDGRRIAGQIHEVTQGDDVARIEDVGRIARSDAVGQVAVTPDLAGGLYGVLEVDLVAVLPVVVIDARAVAGDDDRGDAVHHLPGAGLQPEQVQAYLIVGQRVQERLYDVLRQGHCRGTEQQ